MTPKRKEWFNWVTTEELSTQWKVSQRRVQQILANMKAKNVLEIGVLVLDIGTLNPISKPIYKLVSK